MCRESLIDFSKYELSEDGTIFSKYYNRSLEGCVQQGGYVRVHLKCIDGKRGYYLWQRVIWYYFRGDIPENIQVNHIDENKQNNAISNLNLLTQEQNNNWGTRNERVAKALKNHPKKSKQVAQIDLKTGEILAIFPSTREVERQLGFSNIHISRCCNGGYYSKGKWYNKPQAYGFGWKYI